MRKTKIYVILLAVLSLLLYNSCSKENTFDCVKSTGTIIKEDRYFENFNTINIEDNINVILMQDMPGKITIEGGENLLPKIKSEQNGTTITISNKNTCNWVRSYDKPLNVYVGINQVIEVSQTGYGTITNGEPLVGDTLRIYNLTFGVTRIENIKLNFLGFIVDDHGTFMAKGKARTIAGNCFKNGLTNVQGMPAKWVYMINYSLLDARVFSDSLMQSRIGGDGNIICKGQPIYREYINEGGKGTVLYE